MTNLIDVAFVLLIIFMITAPIMQGGIEVQLPEAESEPIASTDAITLSITERGEMFLGETAITLAELRGQVESQRAARPNAPVHLKVDANARYEPFAQALGVLKSMGITDVGVPVMPVREN